MVGGGFSTFMLSNSKHCLYHNQKNEPSFESSCTLDFPGGHISEAQKQLGESPRKPVFMAMGRLDS